MKIQEPFASRAMILNPDLWPIYPLLPLTRATAEDIENYGYLDARDPSLIVHVGLVVGPMPTGTKLYYADVDKLLADGWRVD